MRKIVMAFVCIASFICSLNAWALQPSDWPVWGQNPANTRSNANEPSVPPSPPDPLLPIWSYGPAGDAGSLGIRYGIIAEGAVYGSYLSANSTKVEGRNLLTGVPLPTWGAPFPKVINNAWSYYPPSFVRGKLAIGFGGFGKNPCTGASLRVFDAITGTNALINLTANPYLYGTRVAYAGTAVESTGNFYFSGLCPTATSGNPVRSAALNVPLNSFKPWPALPYKQFGSGDFNASFSPAVANGMVALALARPSTPPCNIGTARIAIFNESNGADLCPPSGIGPYVTAFDETPPAMTSDRIYSVNFMALGPTAFNLPSCLAGGSGACNLITGSAGPNGGKGFAVANGFVFTSHVGASGMMIQSWNADMSVLIDTFTAADIVSPYIAEANGYIYFVGETFGCPYALPYDVASGIFNPAGVVSGGASGFSTGPCGVAAVGGGVLIVSSPTLVRAYQLQTVLPVITAIIVTPAICPPGPVNTYLSLDSAFDHGTGKLADARIMGLSMDGLGVPNGQFGLVYDTITDQWNCFSGMSIPAGETCTGIYSTAISILNANEAWVAGHPYGCPTAENNYVWKLFPSTPATWSPPMPSAPSPWNSHFNNMNGIAMSRGVPGLVTGWTGVTPGAAFFNGTAWSNPMGIVNGTIVGSLGSTSEMDKISFPYGNSTDGWSTAYGSQIYLDTVNYPAPGAWVQPSPYFTNGFQFSVHVNAPNDIWACGTDWGSATILHSTIPALSGGIPTPISIPPPVGSWTVPALFDITFYELDPSHKKGVAVGGDWFPSAGTTPIIYVTEDHGVNWTFVPLSVPPTFTGVQLRHVRFVSVNIAYASGLATDIVTGLAIPFLVKVTL